MLLLRRAGLCASAILAIQCGGPSEARVEKADDPTVALDLRLQSLTGGRDGARFAATAVFSGGAGTLTMDMNFQIGVPTVLTAGSYRFQSPEGIEEGDAQSTSVTFLGGQSDRPNLGGVFLLRSQGVARYRVVIPTMETQKPSQGRRPEIPFPSETRN